MHVVQYPLVGVFQPSRGVGGLPSLFLVGEVELDREPARAGQRFVEERHERVVHVRAGAVGEDDDVGFTGAVVRRLHNDRGHLHASVHGDRFGALAQSGHKVSSPSRRAACRSSSLSVS